jgi:signal transduction histidine kinase
VSDKELELAIEFGWDQHQTFQSLQKDLRLYQALFAREEHVEGERIQSAEILRDVVGAVAQELSASFVSAITELSWLAESSTVQGLERRCVRSVVRTCEAAHKLTQRLLWAAQEGPRELSIVLVSELVHEVVQRLGSWVKPIKDLTLSFERDDLVVFCDRQAVVNALIGAVVSFDRARSAPGPIGISVYSVDGEGTEIEERERTASEYVMITLQSADTQLQLADVEAMTRTFAPEHSVPEQVGLGLAVAFGVVRAHGGWMEVSSDPTKGARVALFLPQVRAH